MVGQTYAKQLQEGRVTPARQQRSRATLERILRAAATLLEDRDFDELSMADVARAARCSVGTMYYRIPGKQALLRCLYDMYASRLTERVSQLVERHSEKEIDLHDRVEQLAETFINLYVEQAGVVRALAQHLYRDRHGEYEVFRAQGTAQLHRCADFLMRSSDEIPHQRPRRACQLGLAFFSAAAWHRIVFADRLGLKIKASLRTLRVELSRMLYAYLALPEEDA